MKQGDKFSALSNAISENSSYRLNANGVKLVRQYHSVMAQLESAVAPIVGILVKDKNKVCKQAAVQIVSSINSNKEGNETFDMMTRLDTLTNGGKTPIQGASFTFNQNDKILQYLENI